MKEMTRGARRWHEEGGMRPEVRWASQWRKEGGGKAGARWARRHRKEGGVARPWGTLVRQRRDREWRQQERHLWELWWRRRQQPWSMQWCRRGGWWQCMSLRGHDGGKGR